MGIDLATWRARIGINYYHMCRPLQTRWRSSGGQLYQPGVASWGVREVMNDTPLVLKGCMTVVALSLILQYVVHSWLKLRARGGGGKVHCHWQGSAFQVKGTLLLKAIVVVIPLLLVIAGDVETNPGPGEPSLVDLLEELHPICSRWYNIGLLLHIQHTILERFKEMHRDPLDLMREMLIHWLKTAVDPPPTWKTVTTALRSPLLNEINLAAQLESKYCSQYDAREEPSCHTQVEMKEEVSDQASLGSCKTKRVQFHACSTPAFKIPTTNAAKYTDSSGFQSVQKKPQLDIDTGPDGNSTSPSPSEGSQKPPFGYERGKCTFFSLGCPTPTSSASSFPYLDLSELTPEQQQELKGRLRFESREIMIRFQELVSGTVESLIGRNVSPKKLVTHVMTLGAFDSVLEKPQVPVLCHRLDELKAAKTIYDIFLVLNDYFSFFNYQLIEHIIKELGTEEDKAELQRYKEDFNQYAKRRIFECPPEFGPIRDANHADIFVKLDSQYDNYAVAEMVEFRHKLSKILHLSSQGILHLCRVDKGCFQLMFQIPSFVQHKIFPLSREQERILAAMGVIKLTCGEYQFLKGQSSQAEVDKRDDPDDESGIGPSIYTDTESITSSGHEIVPHLSGEREKALGVKCGEYWFQEDELSQAKVDGDYGMGLSQLFTDTKSTKGHREEELDYELKVQNLVETVSFHKSGSDLELHCATTMGQLENVRYLVEKERCNPMQRDHSGFAAFHLAAIEGKVQVFKYFVTERNCNPACPGPLGLTPLHLASYQGHLDMVKYLVIEQQMEPLCEDEYGNTPLHRACAGNCQAVVEFLTSKLTEFYHLPKLVSELKNKWDSTALHIATWNGHLKILKFFISDLSCDPNIPGLYGGTPLHYAAEFGHLHIVKYFIDEQGCNPSCLDEDKHTPLHLAALEGYMDIVKFLTMEKHCDPMCKDSDLDTPLHMAALNGHIDIAKFLIFEMHCNPTVRNANNDTALHLTVMNGHLDILQFFISDLNCDPNIPGLYGQTPLHYAAEFGHLHIAKYLTDEQGCNSTCLDENKYTPLHHAAVEGHIDIVKFLTVEKHCHPMCRDSKHNTPLHLAALGGHIETVKLLTLEIHCDPASRNAVTATALHLAAVKGYLDIVHFFISELNCDPNLSGGQYGGTPLHCAATYGHLHIVKYLTDEQGCDPSTCLDKNMSTPLHCAAAMGHVEIVKFLILEKHCDPMCAEIHQTTPLHIAANNGHTDIVKFLTLEMHCDPTKKTANNNSALHAAVSNGHLDIVRFFISDQNCDPNIAGQYDLPPLHYAAHLGHLHIIKYLVDEQGCNPSCLDKQRGTPLQGAAAHGHIDIVKFLAVEKHCDPMLRNIYGNAALHSAVVLGHLEIVKFLIEEMKCPPDAPGLLNMTPLQLARNVNHPDIAQYLQKHSVIPYIHTAVATMKQLGLLK